MADQASESMKSVAVKGVATLTAQNIALQMFWFLTSFVLLNAISVSDFSIMKLVFAAVAVPSALYIAGIDPIILADMGVEREHGRMGELKSLFRSYVIFEIVSAVLIWLGFTLAITFFRNHFDPATQGYLFVASFSIFVRPVQNVLIQFFNLFFRFRHITFLKVFDEGITLLAMIYFVFYLKQGLHTAILIQVVAPFLSILLSLPAFFHVYRKQLGHVTPKPAGFFARLKSHGKWSVAAAYVLTGWDALRLFLIDRLIGREAVAVYSLADSLWGYLTNLFPVKSVLSAMMPQRSKDEVMARQNLVRGFKYAFLGFVALGVCAAIGGYPFLRILFPKYVAAFPVFLGLLLLIPKFAFSSALGPLLRAYKFQRSGFGASVCSAAVTGAVAFILYPMFGMGGVVAEVVITNSLLIWISYASFIRAYPAFRLRLSEFWIWDRYDADTVRMLFDGLRRRFIRS